MLSFSISVPFCPIYFINVSFRSPCSARRYEKPEAVTALETTIDALWVEQGKQSAAKRLVLEDDLARELYAEDTRLMSEQHAQATEHLRQWAAAQAAYLKAHKAAETIAEAQFHLAVFEA